MKKQTKQTIAKIVFFSFILGIFHSQLFSEKPPLPEPYIEDIINKTGNPLSIIWGTYTKKLDQYHQVAVPDEDGADTSLAIPLILNGTSKSVLSNKNGTPATFDSTKMLSLKPMKSKGVAWMEQSLLTPGKACLSFRAKGEEGIQVNFATKEQFDKNSYTWKIVIGGWQNTRAAIIKGNTLVAYTDASQSPSARARAGRFPLFWASINNGFIMVGEGLPGANVFLTWYDPDEPSPDRVGFSCDAKNVSFTEVQALPCITPIPTDTIYFNVKEPLSASQNSASSMWLTNYPLRIPNLGGVCCNVIQPAETNIHIAFGNAKINNENKIPYEFIIGPERTSLLKNGIVVSSVQTRLNASKTAQKIWAITNYGMMMFGIGEPGTNPMLVWNDLDFDKKLNIELVGLRASSSKQKALGGSTINPELDKLLEDTSRFYNIKGSWKYSGGELNDGDIVEIRRANDQHIWWFKQGNDYNPTTSLYEIVLSPFSLPATKSGAQLFQIKRTGGGPLKDNDIIQLIPLFQEPLVEQDKDKSPLMRLTMLEGGDKLYNLGVKAFDRALKQSFKIVRSDRRQPVSGQNYAPFSGAIKSGEAIELVEASTGKRLAFARHEKLKKPGELDTIIAKSSGNREDIQFNLIKVTPPKGFERGDKLATVVKLYPKFYADPEGIPARFFVPAAPPTPQTTYIPNKLEILQVIYRAIDKNAPIAEAHLRNLGTRLPSVLAAYRQNPSQEADVTSAIRNRVDSSGLSMPGDFTSITNNDPAPFKPKELYVRYRFGSGGERSYVYHEGTPFNIPHEPDTVITPPTPIHNTTRLAPGSLASVQTEDEESTFDTTTLINRAKETFADKAFDELAPNILRSDIIDETKSGASVTFNNFQIIPPIYLDFEPKDEGYKKDTDFFQYSSGLSIIFPFLYEFRQRENQIWVTEHICGSQTAIVGMTQPGAIYKYSLTINTQGLPSFLLKQAPSKGDKILAMEANVKALEDQAFEQLMRAQTIEADANAKKEIAQSRQEFAESLYSAGSAIGSMGGSPIASAVTAAVGAAAVGVGIGFSADALAKKEEAAGVTKEAELQKIQSQRTSQESAKAQKNKEELLQEIGFVASEQVKAQKQASLSVPAEAQQNAQYIAKAMSDINTQGYNPLVLEHFTTLLNLYGNIIARINHPATISNTVTKYAFLKGVLKLITDAVPKFNELKQKPLAQFKDLLSLLIDCYGNYYLYKADDQTDNAYKNNFYSGISLIFRHILDYYNDKQVGFVINPMYGAYIWLPSATHTFGTSGTFSEVDKGSISFDAQGIEDVLIGLAASAVLPQDTQKEMYEINIGKQKNRATDIKLRIRDQTYSTKIILEKENPNALLDPLGFKKFWISFNNGIITLGLNELKKENVLISWTDPYPIKGIKQIGISNGFSPITYRNLKLGPCLEDAETAISKGWAQGITLQSIDRKAAAEEKNAYAPLKDAESASQAEEASSEDATTETPVAEEVTTEDTTSTVEPITEETTIEEATTEETAEPSDESATAGEETSTEDATTEDTTSTEEPVIEEATSEETTPKEATKGETAEPSEESATTDEEASMEDATAEEPIAEEETTSEELITEDTTSTEEPVIEEATSEEATTEETTEPSEE